MRNAILCDLDGTLALFEHHRGPYQEHKAEKDIVNTPVWEVLTAVSEKFDYQVIYMSGRQDSARQVTEKWLKDNNCPEGPLFMRMAGDRSPDSSVKKDLYFKHVAPHYNVLFCIDDRPRVVKVWRDLGLFVFDVNQSGKDF